MSNNTHCIFIIGPSSTGKTTLCRALVEHFSTSASAHIAEVARDIIKKEGFSRKDVATLEMQGAILSAQLSREDAVLSSDSHHGMVISDRSCIDPVVYAILNGRTEDEKDDRRRALTETEGFQRALKRYRKSIVLLLAPVSEWLVDDGIRSLDDHENCLAVFREVLCSLDIPFFEMGPEKMQLDHRVQQVTTYLGL
jgi:nicotinamide riboside kinase